MAALLCRRSVCFPPAVAVGRLHFESVLARREAGQEVVLFDANSSGVEDVAVETVSSGEDIYYNAAGVRVDRNYPGIVIRKGSKFLNR